MTIFVMLYTNFYVENTNITHWFVIWLNHANKKYFIGWFYNVKL